jgi:hypothetical protein
MTSRFLKLDAFAVLLGFLAALPALAGFTLADEATPTAAKTAATADEPAAPKPTYDLRYKCAIGDILRYEVAHRASIRSTIDEVTQAAQTKTDSVKSWKISDVLPSGDIEFLTVVERVHMVNQLPNTEPTEYDSQRDKTPPPGYEDAARSVGVPLSLIRIAPNGKVLRREMKLKRSGPEEDGPLTVLLPEEPVPIGDSWDEAFDLTVTLRTGGSKLVHTRRHYKLTKVEAGIATISVDYQVLSPIDAHVEAQIVERLLDGEVRFDIEAGRIVSQKMEIDKRILGFAGPTSSMHYVVRMEEKLVHAPHKLTVKPAEKPILRTAEAPAKSVVTPPANPTGPSAPPPGTARPRNTRPPRGTQRR